MGEAAVRRRKGGEAMLVTIERIERRKGSKGPYHLVHLAGGSKLYCWDAQLAQGLGPGLYEVEVKQGEFPRLLSARPVASHDGAKEAPQEATVQERLEALRVVLTLAQWTRLESVDQVLAAAEKVLGWLKGGRG